MRHFHRGLAAVLFAAFALHATTSLAQPSTASIGWSKSFDTPQISIAVDKDLWKKHDLTMSSVTFGSGREAFEALLGGQVDFIVVGDLPVVTGALRKQSFVVVADLSRFYGHRLVTTTSVATLEDLAGRKIGTTVGTSLQFVLDAALKQHGIKAEIVNAAPSDLLPVLARGDVDAALTFAGFQSQARRILGDRYREFPLPGETHLLLAASKDVVQKRPEIVRKALMAILDADQLVQADPAAAREAIARMSAGALKVDALAALWPQYDFRTRLDKPLLDLLVEQGQWILGTGMVKGVTVTPQLFQPYLEPAPLKALDAGRVSGL